jgi:hypothetical protein
MNDTSVRPLKELTPLSPWCDFLTYQPILWSCLTRHPFLVIALLLLGLLGEALPKVVDSGLGFVTLAIEVALICKIIPDMSTQLTGDER